MMEAIVESVEYVPYVWFRIKVKELNKPLMLHWNWFVSRNALVPHGSSYEQTAIKPGDRVRFEVAKYPVYLNDSENLYVKNFQVIGSGVEEVEMDVSI